MTPENASLLAVYNRWMNERLYDSAAKIDAAALSYRSIVGVTDLLAVSPDTKT